MGYSYERKINYYETDKMGVVHHSNYIRFLEESRCSLLDHYGLPMEKIEELGFTIPFLEINCKYKNHVTSGDVLVIKPVISEYNGVRMKVSYEVTNKKTGDIVIEVWTKHCFTNKELRPINMKKYNPEINALFEKLLENN